MIVWKLGGGLQLAVENQTVKSCSLIMVYGDSVLSIKPFITKLKHYNKSSSNSKLVQNPVYRTISVVIKFHHLADSMSAMHVVSTYSGCSMKLCFGASPHKTKQLRFLKNI